MSIFTIAYLGQAANPATTASIDALSFLMLGFGVLGIILTLLMKFKSKRLYSSHANSRNERVQSRNYLCKLATKFDQTEPELANELRWFARA